MSATFALALLGVLFLQSGAVYADNGVLPVTGTVNVSSRLGQETIPLSGTATVQWGNPHLFGGNMVVDTEIVSMSLTGTSLTGPVSVAESASLVSSGRNTGSPTDPFPASTYFNVYVTITAPAAPGPTITLTNSTAIHLAGPLIYDWPPSGIVYTANPSPCIPLFPTNPMSACLNAMSFTAGAPPAVGGIARLSGIESAPLALAHDSGPNVGLFPALAAGVLLALVSSAWWAQRRRTAR